MARKKVIKGASAATALPTGPVLLGRLVNALGAPTTASSFEDIAGRTAHRFYSGERIEDEKIEALFAALGVALVELGFTPAAGWRPATGMSPAKRVEHALRHMVERWDAAIAEVR